MWGLLVSMHMLTTNTLMVKPRKTGMFKETLLNILTRLLLNMKLSNKLRGRTIAQQTHPTTILCQDKSKSPNSPRICKS